MRISGFEWDDGHILHLALGHGIEPEEAEEIFAVPPLFRGTKQGHYAAFGRTQAGRLLIMVFERKARGLIRVITGWDMNVAERQYFHRHRKD